MIRFGMHSSLWTGSWTVPAAENLVPQAAKHGLELIEVPLFNPEAIDVAHTVALLRQYGIAPSASICLPPGDAAALFPERGERFVMRALEVAHALGCTFLGGVTYSSLGWRSGKPPVEEEYANVVRALKPVARRAQEYGIQLGLEPCNRYETHLINTAAQCLAVIERIGEPNLVCHLDTYHMNIEEKGFGNGFRVAGKYCSYVHLSESDRGVPGTGNVDFEDIFKTLAQIGFEGDLVIESFIALPPEIASALCVWRPVAKSAAEVLTQGVPYLKNLARGVGLID